jgi:hypothetical protein
VRLAKIRLPSGQWVMPRATRKGGRSLVMSLPS